MPRVLRFTNEVESRQNIIGIPSARREESIDRRNGAGPAVGIRLSDTRPVRTANRVLSSFTAHPLFDDFPVCGRRLLADNTLNLKFAVLITAATGRYWAALDEVNPAPISLSGLMGLSGLR